MRTDCACRVFFLMKTLSDRNGLASPTAAVQFNRSRRDAVRQMQVQGAPLSETKVKADLASRFSVRSARNFIPEQSETYICHHLPRIKRC